MSWFYLDLRKEKDVIEPNAEKRVGVEEYGYLNRWSLSVQVVLHWSLSSPETNKCAPSIIFWSQFFFVLYGDLQSTVQ